MVAGVPSLESQTYLTDPQSIIAYQYRRYERMPKDAVTILPDLIVSLPYQISQFGKQPNILVTNIQTDLQGVYDRIFNGERQVNVLVTQIPNDLNGYDINISISYQTLANEMEQIGTKISLNSKGQLVIPEDTINFGPLLQ